MPKTAKTTTAKSVKTSPVIVGTVLKRAFPDKNADQLKTLRRYLRKALRADAGFKFHKIGTRWVFPTAKDVAAARIIAKDVLQ